MSILNDLISVESGLANSSARKRVEKALGNPQSLLCKIDRLVAERAWYLSGHRERVPLHTAVFSVLSRTCYWTFWSFTIPFLSFGFAFACEWISEKTLNRLVFDTVVASALVGMLAAYRTTASIRRREFQGVGGLFDAMAYAVLFTAFDSTAAIFLFLIPGVDVSNVFGTIALVIVFVHSLASAFFSSYAVFENRLTTRKRRQIIMIMGYGGLIIMMIRCLTMNLLGFASCTGIAYVFGASTMQLKAIVFCGGIASFTAATQLAAFKVGDDDDPFGSIDVNLFKYFHHARAVSLCIFASVICASSLAVLWAIFMGEFVLETVFGGIFASLIFVAGISIQITGVAQRGLRRWGGSVPERTVRYVVMRLLGAGALCWISFSMLICYVGPFPREHIVVLFGGFQPLLIWIVQSIVLNTLTLPDVGGGVQRPNSIGFGPDWNTIRHGVELMLRDLRGRPTVYALAE